MREVPVVSFVNPDGVLSRENVGIHARTEEGLVDGVRLLVTDPRKRLEYAQRAHVYAIARHSLRNAELLERLLDKQPADGGADADEPVTKTSNTVPRFVDQDDWSTR
jgi:hypothetical protein